MKKIILVILLALAFQNCFSQSGAGPKDQELWDHSIGVQINGLIKQIVNSSAGTGANPYLLTYSMHSKKSGWGVRAGIGYNSNNSSNTTPYGYNSVNNTDMNFRAGVEKFFELSKKWTVGAGVDLLYGHNDDNSSNNQYNTYDTTISSQKVIQSNFGGGPFGELTYHFTDRILVGTEISFYYKTGNKDQTVYNYRSGYLPTQTKANPTVSGGSFYLPIVFYLSVRF
jgi:hypothetical protein